MITYRKAIELLSDLVTYSYSASPSDTGDAIRLAIQTMLPFAEEIPSDE